MSGKDGDVAARGRGDRLIKEEIHDPYMARSKPKEPTVCPQCSAVFHKGRWQWSAESVGEAIERAYDGELEIQYTKESNLVRVYWNRDQ